MQKNAQNYCSYLSATAGEPLIGTVGKIEVFFLLEYNGPWEEKAFEKSEIPQDVKQRLSSFSKALPASKILLIKRTQDRQAGLVRFFVGRTGEHEPCIYRFDLHSYEELLDLDLNSVLQVGPKFDQYLKPGSMYLVCTNGRRDQCCAHFGFPIYEALKKRLAGAVWECSHIGGHRFAPNLFHLPYGVLYGRLRLQDLDPLLERTQVGKIHLENLRGCTAYTEVVQVADYYLRQQTGELGLDAYRLGDVTELEPGRWQARFVDNRTGEQSLVELTVEKTEKKVFDSCLLDKQTTVMKYTQGWDY